MPCIVLISLYHKHTIRAISLSYVVRHRTLFSSLIHGIFKQTHLYTTGNDNNQAANQASNQSIRPAALRIQAFKAEWRKPNQTNQDETETSTSSNFCKFICGLRDDWKRVSENECERAHTSTHARIQRKINTTNVEWHKRIARKITVRIWLVEKERKKWKRETRREAKSNTKTRRRERKEKKSNNVEIKWDENGEKRMGFKMWCHCESARCACVCECVCMLCILA